MKSTSLVKSRKKSCSESYTQNDFLKKNLPCCVIGKPLQILYYKLHEMVLTHVVPCVELEWVLYTDPPHYGHGEVGGLEDIDEEPVEDQPTRAVGSQAHGRRIQSIQPEVEINSSS